MLSHWAAEVRWSLPTVPLSIPNSYRTGTARHNRNPVRLWAADRGSPTAARVPGRAVPRGATYWHLREYVRDAAELCALHLDEVDQPAGRGDHDLRTWRSAALHAAHGWWTRASEPSEETI